MGSPAVGKGQRFSRKQDGESGSPKDAPPMPEAGARLRTPYRLPHPGTRSRSSAFRRIAYPHQGERGGLAACLFIPPSISIRRR